MFAIVDIETTGGNARLHRIIELAVVLHDGERVTAKHQWLINPETGIPSYIQGLTGIYPHMLADAPTFAEIAEEVYEVLQNQVFVAHNVSFDYPFVEAALQKHGFELDSMKLCTVRASRKIIPGLPSYSLGRLCESLNIEIDGRHRAYGDAAATASLFSLLLQKDSEAYIETLYKKSKRTIALPPLLPQGILEKLPSTSGVYYFHDAHGKVLYVGKALDIKKRVKSHFSGQGDLRFEKFFSESLSDITWQETGSEIMASLLEVQEIKRLWPKYNTSSKHRRKEYGLCLFEDRQGYLHLSIADQMKGARLIKRLGYRSQAQEVLLDLVERFSLCANLCHLEHNRTGCSLYQVGTCKGACLHLEDPQSYNERVNAGLDYLESKGETFFIEEQGRTNDERTLILIEQGRFAGYAYLPYEFSYHQFNSLIDAIKRTVPDPELDRLIRQYIEKKPLKLIYPSDVSV